MVGLYHICGLTMFETVTILPCYKKNKSCRCTWSYLKDGAEDRPFNRLWAGFVFLLRAAFCGDGRSYPVVNVF